MKKTILYSVFLFLTFFSFSQSQKVRFNETFELGEPTHFDLKKVKKNLKSTDVSSDNSYFYIANNERYTFEFNSYLNDTPPSQGGTGVDTLGFYSYTVKQKVSSGGDTYWQALTQALPITSELQLNSISFLGSALNSSGSNVNVSVYNKDFTTVLGSKDATFTSAFGLQSVVFDTPISTSDTVIIFLSMNSASDSVKVVYSNNYFTNYDWVGQGTEFQTNLPFKGDAGIYAVEPVTLAYLGWIKFDFDFLTIPNFSYQISSDFSVSSSDVCEGETVTFTNSGDINHIKNPLLNWIEWDYLANSNLPAYTLYDYEGNSTIDYQDTQSGSHDYSNSASYTASASIMIWPWSSSVLVTDGQDFAINVISEADAGSDGSLTICSGITPSETELFNALGGNPDTGGAWTNSGNTYTYTVSATSPCSSPASSVVTITEVIDPNAGTNGSLTICQGTTPSETELFNVLGGNPDTGGSWTNNGLEYTYTVTNQCSVNATSTVTLTESAAPDAGSNGSLIICQGTTPSETELFNALGGNPDTGGSWTGSGSLYTYTVSAIAPCLTNATSTVTVSEQAAPNAGSNGTLKICPGTTPSETELFNALGGNPDTGGAWTNSGNTYTYTVSATSPCSSPASSVVTITEVIAPNAGVNGSITVCEGTTPTNTELFNALGGNPDTGGSWANNGLEYTYTVTNQCSVSSASTVSVTEETAPNAGTNGSITVCEGTTPSMSDLFNALGGNPDAGGSWTGSGLSYTYTVLGSATCSNASSIVTVTEQANPNAGSDGTLIFCQGQEPSESELFDALGGNPDNGGVWTNVGNIYTYSVSATSPCSVNAKAEVTLVEQNCAGLDEIFNNSILIYPNPTSGMLNVRINDYSNETITLLTSDGRIIDSRIITNEIEVFDLNNVKSGMYFIRVNNSILKFTVK